MQKPKPLSGLRHIALFVRNFEGCIDFYRGLLGMRIEWQPDVDNIYLTTGYDNLALHRRQQTFAEKNFQHLDHFGFIIDEIAEVDVWFQYLQEQNIKITATPKTHRDGARSFYCLDPDGNTVQMIYHPSLGAKSNMQSSS